jgi:hypothetical protein
MSRRRHPHSTIERTLAYAESNGWRVEAAGPRGHAWGKILCPHNDPECRCGEFCIASIWSTPRNPENHARQIRRIVDGCTADKRGDQCDER